MRATPDLASAYFDHFSQHFKQNLDMKWASVGLEVGAIPGFLSSCSGLILWWQVGLTWLGVLGLVMLSTVAFSKNEYLGIAAFIGTLIVSCVLTGLVFPEAAQTAMWGVINPFLKVPSGEAAIAGLVLVPIIQLLSPIFVLSGSYGVLAPQIPNGLFLTATGIYNPATAVMTLGQGACLMDAICLVGGAALGALAVVLYQTVDSARETWGCRTIIKIQATGDQRE